MSGLLLNGMYGMDWTYILVIIGAIVSMIASAGVKSSFNKFSRVANRAGLTGAETAARILKAKGVYDVSVAPIRGELTDNFNPRTKIVSLSEVVYNSTSVAALGVAAHECGHAMQHNEGYSPLKFRSAILPVANIGSKFGIPIILIGVLLAGSPRFLGGSDILIRLGIVLFSFGMIFQLVTLPVEFDASRRALATLGEMGLMAEDEVDGARKVLKSAAMTYVASAAATILQVLRLVLIFGGGRRRR
ncbi:MAG: zinc metallopeptidase [Lachnospiraceae bacterium]|nr:zinc metallopeptidase [Lachnospiraceae bacterium]